MGRGKDMSWVKNTEDQVKRALQEENDRCEQERIAQQTTTINLENSIKVAFQTLGLDRLFVILTDLKQSGYKIEGPTSGYCGEFKGPSLSIGGGGESALYHQAVLKRYVKDGGQGANIDDCESWGIFAAYGVSWKITGLALVSQIDFLAIYLPDRNIGFWCHGRIVLPNRDIDDEFVTCIKSFIEIGLKNDIERQVKSGRLIKPSLWRRLLG